MIFKKIIANIVIQSWYEMTFNQSSIGKHVFELLESLSNGIIEYIQAQVISRSKIRRIN
jgi:hypothetical protein